MKEDEELLYECLTAIVVLRDILKNGGLSAGEKRANEIIDKLKQRLKQSELDSEIPPRYNANLKPINLEKKI